MSDNEHDTLTTQLTSASMTQELTQPNDEETQGDELTQKGWGILVSIDNPSNEYILSMDLDMKFTMGRTAQKNDLVVPNVKISGVHCEIKRIKLRDTNATQATITDVSTNGTFLNGQKLHKGRVYKLNNGDELTFIEKRKRRKTNDGTSESTNFGGFIYRDLSPRLSRSKSRLCAKGGLRYQKAELLGQGGCGEVYLGMDTSTGKLLAIKQIPLTNKANEYVKMVEQEIELLMELTHQRIVHYLGSDRSSDTHFNILLEYISGGSVSSLLKKFGIFHENVIRSYTHQILQGLEYLHRKGVIHRDIKGANILVAADGEVKLADFGTSYKMQQSTQRSSPGPSKTILCGTPLWMAPEVVRLERYTLAADIWSLGCTVIEMATGLHPWHKHKFDDPTQVLYWIGTCDAVPEYPDNLSAEGKDFLSRCFALNPDDRWTATRLLKHAFVCEASDSPENFGSQAMEVNIAHVVKDNESNSLETHPHQPDPISNGTTRTLRRRNSTAPSNLPIPTPPVVPPTKLRTPPKHKYKTTPKKRASPKKTTPRRGKKATSHTNNNSSLNGGRQQTILSLFGGMNHAPPNNATNHTGPQGQEGPVDVVGVVSPTHSHNTRLMARRNSLNGVSTTNNKKIKVTPLTPTVSVNGYRKRDRDPISMQLEPTCEAHGVPVSNSTILTDNEATDRDVGSCVSSNRSLSADSIMLSNSGCDAMLVDASNNDNEDNGAVLETGGGLVGLSSSIIERCATNGECLDKRYNSSNSLSLSQPCIVGGAQDDSVLSTTSQTGKHTANYTTPTAPAAGSSELDDSNDSLCSTPRCLSKINTGQPVWNGEFPKQLPDSPPFDEGEEST